MYFEREFEKNTEKEEADSQTLVWFVKKCIFISFGLSSCEVAQRLILLVGHCRHRCRPNIPNSHWKKFKLDYSKEITPTMDEMCGRMRRINTNHFPVPKFKSGLQPVVPKNVPNTLCMLPMEFFFHPTVHRFCTWKYAVRRSNYTFKLTKIQPTMKSITFINNYRKTATATFKM